MAKKNIEKKITEKKPVKKLNAFDTLEKFIAEMQKATNEGTKEVPKFDYKNVIPFTQITWRENHKMHNVPLDIIRPTLIGNIIITIKREISDNCILFSVRTARALYSCKVICEKASFKPDSKGTWGVNPIWYKF